MGNMQVSSHEWEALYVCLATFTTLWTATYFCTAKACAPGHKLELMIAAAYCGTTLDDSLAVHAGRPLTAVSERGGIQLQQHGGGVQLTGILSHRCQQFGTILWLWLVWFLLLFLVLFIIKLIVSFLDWIEP